MFVILPLSLQTSSDVSKDSLIRLSKIIRMPGPLVALPLPVLVAKIQQNGRGRFL